MKASSLPNLSVLVRRVLCIPATSTLSERIFSTAGLTLTKNRARLSGDTVERLVFLKGAPGGLWKSFFKGKRLRGAAPAPRPLIMTYEVRSHRGGRSRRVLPVLHASSIPVRFSTGSRASVGARVEHSSKRSVATHTLVGLAELQV
ncbi:unnamed protein product [Phaeothamnion confervicola]